MHRFSAVAPKPSALTALPDPQAGTPRAPQRTVQYVCGALGRAWRNALRTAFSASRYENLCIIRAMLKRLSGVKSLFGCLPVDDIPPSVDVVGSTVLVVEIVSMFPDIQTNDGDLSFHQRAILIGCGHDLQIF